MNKLQTLNKVVDLAARRRDDALQALGQAQRELQAAQDQMNQLRNYADEALSRWATRSTSGGVDAALLHHHRQFMEKITHAIEFQKSVQRSREEMVEKVQAQVYAAERDVAGLRKYAERQQAAIDHRVMRQEQKTTDEMALTIHLRQSRAQAQGLRS
ncbi:flagellar export protein FliJ [Hydrogenophaga sp. RWCD_12]|uniref:flagellar export protein FliJ n=1 Tax=Hydrogenophaga sp. RWCD_12 TaxID=3391190 RepID=UPI0039856615